MNSTDNSGAAGNTAQTPTSEIHPPKSPTLLPAVPPAINFPYLNTPKSSNDISVSEKPAEAAFPSTDTDSGQKPASVVPGITFRSYASAATPPLAKTTPVPRAPSVQDDTTAMNISAALQRVLDLSEKPLDILIVDGLIRYLFDPSASLGEGLISAAPSSTSNAGANGYSFRLEQRVNARAAHHGLDWPDLNRHSADFWDGPLPPAKKQQPAHLPTNDELSANIDYLEPFPTLPARGPLPLIKQQQPAPLPVNDRLLEDIDDLEPFPSLPNRGPPLSVLRSTDQAQRATRLMRLPHETYLEHDVGSHVVINPVGELEGDFCGAVDQVDVHDIPAPEVTVTVSQDLGYLETVPLSDNSDAEAIVTVDSPDQPTSKPTTGPTTEPTTEPQLQASLEATPEPSETETVVSELSDDDLPVPPVRARRGRKGWVRLELADIY